VAPTGPVACYQFLRGLFHPAGSGARGAAERLVSASRLSTGGRGWAAGGGNAGGGSTPHTGTLRPGLCPSPTQCVVNPPGITQGTLPEVTSATTPGGRQARRGRKRRVRTQALLRGGEAKRPGEGARPR